METTPSSDGQPKVSLRLLREKMATCKACPLFNEAMCKPTPSSGNALKIEKRVVFVGRNPGIQERDARLPFVGRTKQTVDDMLSALGLTRDTAYITNLVKCYTSFPKPDRPPTLEEIKFCAGQHLDQELEFLKPEVVVTFGKDAFVHLSNGIFKTCTGFTGMAIPIPDKPYVLFPLFHPAMLLYNASQYQAKMEDDFGKLFMYLHSRGIVDDTIPF